MNETEVEQKLADLEQCLMDQANLMAETYKAFYESMLLFGLDYGALVHKLEEAGLVDFDDLANRKAMLVSAHDQQEARREEREEDE